MADPIRPKARLAGSFTRFFGLCYDLIVLFCIEFVAFIPIAMAESNLGAIPGAIKTALLISVAYAYFAGFWFKGGETTGMRPWRLRVAMVGSGNNPTLAAASIRFFGMAITWIAFTLVLLYMRAIASGNRESFDLMVSALPPAALGPAIFLVAAIPAVSLLCMLLSKNRQSLHDLLAGTSVYRLGD